MVRVDKPGLLLSVIGIFWLFLLRFQTARYPTRGFQNEITLSLSMTHSAKAGMVDFSAPSKYGWFL